MKLGLVTRPSGPIARPDGTTRIGASDLLVVNAETGEAVENVAAFAWGPVGPMLCGATDALFAPGSLAPDVEYVVIAFRCDAAERMG